MSGRFAANEMQAVAAAAIPGDGIAQLPYQVAEASVRDGRLRRVLDDYTTPVGGFTPCIRAADTFRLWSRHSSSLQPSDWPPPGPARMTRLSRIQPKLQLTGATHDHRAMRPRALIAVAIQTQDGALNSAPVSARRSRFSPHRSRRVG